MEMNMKCLNCNEIWDVSEVEKEGKCPDCGCTDFIVFFEEEED